ncbi:MAG: dUTP diphosphatase [Pseudomonadales bacterium]|nr:dUTP diphosphatase [Pseudomonadales bacterium]
MEKQLSEMLSLQDQMNKKVHPEWREQNFEWYRAIWTECAELMDHFGWKWWKKQTPDIPQIKLEIVDIWHFGMSTYLVASDDYQKIAQEISGQWLNISTEKDFRLAVEALASNTLSEKRISIPYFCQLMVLMEMDIDELYRQYIGKNVLNFFRQDHGYKEGTYIKVWHGKEDNEVLADILTELDPTMDRFKDAVYESLKKNYPS